MAEIFNMDDVEVLVLQTNICINGRRMNPGDLVCVRPDRVSYLEKLGFVVRREHVTDDHIDQVERAKRRAESEAEFLKKKSGSL